MQLREKEPIPTSRRPSLARRDPTKRTLLLGRGVDRMKGLSSTRPGRKVWRCQQRAICPSLLLVVRTGQLSISREVICDIPWRVGRRLENQWHEGE